MSTVPFGIMSGYSILNEIKVNKVMVVTIVAFICVLTYSDIKRCVYERIYLESKNGQAIHDGTDYKGYYKYYASEDDYNVSLWLKNNTESNDIIAVDQFQVNDYRKEEIYGVFSQRYIYNDGAYESDAETAKRRTNVQLFINSITEGYNALVSDGVKYLIVHKNVNGKSRIDHCEKVYESTECDIYKIIW